MKYYYVLLLFLGLAATSFGQVTTNPNPILVDQPVTITVDINSNASNCNGFNNPTKVYLHAGIGDDSNPWGFNVIGNWGQDDGVGLMTNNGNGIWSITFTPQTYFGLNSTQITQASKMGMVFRNENGSQELKNTGCTDFFFNVGAFQLTMINPPSSANGVLVVPYGGNTQILAMNSGGPANYELFVNGSSVHTQNNTTFYNGYAFSNLTEIKHCELVITQGSTTITRTFMILVGNAPQQALPGGMIDGINYNSTTSATLVLTAPNKDYVYVTGSFNDWQPSSTYLMKKDPSSGKFWLQLNGLTPGQDYTYQYWVVDETPISNSPALVKTADPYSTLVLSPYDDPWIPSSSYPNLPAYPAGQEREVTLLKTGQTPYNWQVTNFTKPKKEDLIVYEVLIRDFDAGRNYQSLIDKIDYFKNLNINAIELMPVMEYEGNESWGYNTAFHMALDKYYGTENKLKEFIDLCHQNGIAVILDVALNHAFGRNPMVRMWMNDPDGDGWGGPSSENPYFNQTAMHSYSVGEDFNHQSSLTQTYVQRVIKHWIEEFKIDGFRWDLTKGFTQNCPNNEGCTNSYQQDRVDILKAYADYSWSLDSEHYVIFEHLGNENEEKEWANYRYNEGKGVMMWGKMTDPYNQLTMGYNSNNNIAGVGHKSRTSFLGPRVIGYAESHDEERLMYKNVTYGNSSNSTHNVTNLNTALSRMSALGAVTIPVPGPKMIWHFGDLGMDDSIFTCNDGTVNEPGGSDGDCKLDTKPQPQWTENWLGNPNRNKIYNDWARMIQLKIDEPVFEGDYVINSGNTLTPRIYVYDNSIPATELRNVVILANFDVTAQNVVPDFPYTGQWHDLMDETGNTFINVSNTASPINIPAGQFKMYGNKPATLGLDENAVSPFTIYPNPVNTEFYVNKSVNALQIFDLTGKLVKSFKGTFGNTDAFDISDLTRSIYIIKIENPNGQTFSAKLVKL
ncbi:MAG TPA: alpha-amylase family glycosyl hydrolase [Aquaticitalea sp.]|nr:alpha-amylase family glycosyl hydrolase [Aquaticitalea sp.]